MECPDEWKTVTAMIPLIVVMRNINTYKRHMSKIYLCNKLNTSTNLPFISQKFAATQSPTDFLHWGNCVEATPRHHFSRAG